LSTADKKRKIYGFIKQEKMMGVRGGKSGACPIGCYCQLYMRSNAEGASFCLNFIPDEGIYAGGGLKPWPGGS